MTLPAYTYPTLTVIKGGGSGFSGIAPPSLTVIKGGKSAAPTLVVIKGGGSGFVAPTAASGSKVLLLGKAVVAGGLFAIALGSALVYVLLTPKPTGDLTISSTGPVSPYILPPPKPATTTTTTIPTTTYKSPVTPSGSPPYHKWGGKLGAAQSLYLGSVPHGDKIAWAYLRHGWAGGGLITPSSYDSGDFMKKADDFFLPAGLTTKDSLILWFGRNFPRDWTDLGKTWLPSMMSADDPRANPARHRWKWDGYGWLFQPTRFDPDSVYWEDGGIHPEHMDRMYAMGNFAHALAQRGLFQDAWGDLRRTFTRLYAGLTFVIRYIEVFDVWNEEQLADYAWEKTKGKSADPYEAISLLKAKTSLRTPPAEEFVVWESSSSSKVPFISLVKKKKKKMPCCTKIQCAQILNRLKKIEEHTNWTLEGWRPPVCAEAGTLEPLTGEPYDWEDPKMDALIKASPDLFKEAYAGKGFDGISQQLAMMLHVILTAIGTERARQLWCEVESPKIEVKYVLGGISEDAFVDLPDATIFVIIEITVVALSLVKNIQVSSDPGIPNSIWGGHVAFYDGSGHASLDYKLTSMQTRLPLPFLSPKLLVRPAPGVEFDVKVEKYVLK